MLINMYIDFNNRQRYHNDKIVEQKGRIVKQKE